MLNENRRPGWVLGGVDMRYLARWQRRLAWVTLFALAAQIAIVLLPSRSSIDQVAIFAGANLVSLVLLLACAVTVLSALGDSSLTIIVYGVLLFAPCANLIILLMIHWRATRALRRAGLHIGLMGVKDAEVVRLLSGHLCRTCGYDLTGNVSGRCSECGTEIPRDVPVPQAADSPESGDV